MPGTCSTATYARRLALGAAVLAAAVFGGCGGGGGGAVPTVPPTPAQKLGDPIPGLTAAEQQAFERGRAVFVRRFRPSEGLGPFYNATACASCHSTPMPGGSSKRYRNFYLAKYGFSGSLQPLPPFLGPVIPAYGTGATHPTSTFSLTGGRTPLPDTYLGFPVVSAQRNALPVFGVGLFEMVPESDIVSRADPDDLDRDGISGRYNTDAGDLGRLGVKCQSSTIERFTRGPLQNQMGITTNPLVASPKPIPPPGTGQVSANPNDPTIDQDGVQDPELGAQDLSDLVLFGRFLAPPPTPVLDARGTRGSARFQEAGCVACHVPSLPTPRGAIQPYTDLLLHDMGPDLADGISFGVPQTSANDGSTTGSEFRTQPLWGVSMHAPYLHDGRADTLREAVVLHGGEALASRNAFLALAAADQDDLLAFLEEL